MQKVDNQRDDFNNRFSELTLRLEELPKALAAMQSTTRESPAFTFRTAGDKLSLQKHLTRRDSRNRDGPYTDLEPFTIPDDMKATLEARIRQREMSKSEADRLSAEELADAYRRLQLAGNPRVGELSIRVDQCQEEMKRALQLIRTSNLQLYSCCESKVEKSEITALRQELHELRSRMRDMLSVKGSRLTKPSANESKPGDPTSNLMINTVARTNKQFKTGGMLEKEATALKLTHAQIPELRVSLLELCRNFNLLKKKKHPNAPNAVAKTHLEKIVAMVHEAYATTAEEPVDLATVAMHVERVAQVLGSDFSIQVLASMGTHTDDNFRLSLTAANEMTTALCKYSHAFTDLLHLEDDKTKMIASAAMKEWSLENRHLEKLDQDVQDFARSQRKLEEALAEIAKKVNATPSHVAVVIPSAPAVQDPIEQRPPAPVSPVGNEWKRVHDDLQSLQRQILAIKKSFVTEEMLADVLRQLEQRKHQQQQQDGQAANGGVVGHRFAGGVAPIGAMGSPINNNSLSKRRYSAEFDLTGLMDTEDRPKSQTKLDPLQIHKLTGEVRSSAKQSAVSLALRNETKTGRSGGNLSQIQSRAQMLRPKSGLGGLDTPK